MPRRCSGNILKSEGYAAAHKGFPRDIGPPRVSWSGYPSTIRAQVDIPPTRPKWARVSWIEPASENTVAKIFRAADQMFLGESGSLHPERDCEIDKNL